MPKKSTKTKAKTNKKLVKNEAKSILHHPSTWIAAVLLLALLVIYGLSMFGLNVAEKKTKLESAELATFGHIAEMYIKDMEFYTNYDQPTIKKATGYGVSDEDGALYITFDYATYPEEHNYSYEDLDMRHAIIYFQRDDERNTYGHAFGYYDDASYHPDGTYVKLED